MLPILETEQALQKQNSFKHRKKRALETFEEATEKGKYNYWLTQEDIADIARIEYNYFRRSSGIPDLFSFEISGSIAQLTTQIENFQASTQLTGNRLTLIINLRNQHWVTLVLTRQYSAYDGFYIDSQGRPLPDEYYGLLRRFNIVVNDFSLHFSQQADGYNCGLWALENADDINKMLDGAETFDWLTTQVKRPRNRYYFNTLRRLLVQKLYLDRERNDRLQSHSQGSQSRDQLPKVYESPSTLEQGETMPKRIKVQLVEKANSKTRLENFVASYLGYFRQRLAAFQLITRGEKLTVSALEQELKIGATGALFGLLVSQGLVGIMPSLVASLRTVSGRYYISEKKAKKITRLFQNVNSGDLSKILAEAAVEIFQSYEAQYMHITDIAGDKVAIEKIAEDAVARTINYIFENDNISHISVEFITKAIILGTSDKYFDPNFKKFRLSISGNPIQDEYQNKIYTTDLFEKVGLVIFTEEGSVKFYKKLKFTDVEQYGYRRVLSWEKASNNELLGNYEQDYGLVVAHPEVEAGFKRDLQNYKYQPIATQAKTQEILTRIQTSQDTSLVVKPSEKKSILFNLREPVENFIGRIAALNELHQTLLSGGVSTIVSAISAMSLDSSVNPGLVSGSQASVSGLGGIGKTQLALRYAQLHATDYDNNVLWINSETEADISRSFLKLATQLDIETKSKYIESKDIETIVEEVYGYFSDRKSLFIFDNVENYLELEKFLPKLMIGNKPNVLITSRYKNWKNAAAVISLDVFTEQESLELVKQGLTITDDFQDAKIKELNNLLQGLPLALQQAIAYIRNQRNINSEFSVENYLEIFKEKSKAILDFNFRFYSNDPYLKTVYTTWQVTLDIIRREGNVGKTAIEILNIMSFIFPENISSETFIVFYQSEKLASAMHLLKVYSMTSSGSISSEYVVHRLVQKVVNIYLESEPNQFREIALKTEALVMYYSGNMETRFHYVHFLLNVLEHPELEEYLQFKSSFKRISSILMIADVKVWNYFFDIAYTKFNKKKYIEFLSEAFLNYRKLAAPFYVLNTLSYIEKKLAEGILTKSDVKAILDSENFRLKPEYRVNHISTMPEKRERQLYVVSLIRSFKTKMFPEEYLALCLSDRKKRSIMGSCLLENKALKEKKQQRTAQHLEKVSHIAGFVSTGLFTKDTLAALLQGDFNTVAINFGLLLSGRFFGKLSNELLAQGEKFTADEGAFLQKNLGLEDKLALSIFFNEEVSLAGKKRFLGKTLKMAAPFIARGTSIFFAYNLMNDIEEYQSGDTSVLSGIVFNGAIVAIDGVEAGIEAAELLEIITGVSEFTGPVGEGLAVLIWLGAEGYETNKGLDAIEKCVDLTLSEKFIQGLRLFFHLGPSEYIELKAKNNQLVKQALAFLKEHSAIKKYVFSAAFTKSALQQRSEVRLDKKTNVLLTDSMPDSPSAGQLLCVSGTPTASTGMFLHFGRAEKTNVYLCKKAIGIEYSVNRTGDATLIALDKGNDKVIVVSDSPVIFLVNDGNKEYKGNDKGNLFVLLGNKVTGTLQGGSGVDIITLNNFYANTSAFTLIDKNGFLCEKELVNSTVQECDLQNKVELKNINQIYGRSNKKDIFFLSKNITLVDGKGGEDEELQDSIYITDEAEKKLSIVLRNNTVVYCSNSTQDSIDYSIPNSQQGKAWVKFPFLENVQLRFFFEYYLENISALTIENSRVQFSLSASLAMDFPNKTFTVVLENTNNSTLYLQQAANCTELPKNTSYFFKEGVEIQFLDVNHIYAKADNVRTIDEIVNNFIGVANRLKKSFTVQLTHNQTVSIGREKNEIFTTNCLAESYLVGNGGENVYVLSPLNTTLFPLPEVTLYDVDGEEDEDCVDTLDLREVEEKAKRACPIQSLSTAIYLDRDDLIIKLNTYYYLLNGQCILLDNSWVIATIRLKKALLTEWHQKLDILLEDNRPRNILYTKNNGWTLTDKPLTISDDKEIIVITNQDINQNSELAMLKNRGNFTFLQRNKTDLIITNVQDINTSQYDLYTIICSQFYELAEMREKVLSSTFTFLDQALHFRDYEEQINAAISFSSVLNSYSRLNMSDDIQSRATNLTNDTVAMARNKRQVNLKLEKPVSSSATKNSSPLSSLLNWVKEQGNRLVLEINNYVKTLNKRAFFLFSNTHAVKEDNYLKPKHSPANQTIESFFENQPKRKIAKNGYSKSNDFYKETMFFTQIADYQKSSSFTCLKNQANYRKSIFCANDAPLTYPDNKLHNTERFFSQIDAKVDVNETLLFADYLLRTMFKKNSKPTSSELKSLPIKEINLNGTAPSLFG
ncbi:MAG: NB-ARC domain-containing protein [Pseudomonadota bacterium]